MSARVRGLKHIYSLLTSGEKRCRHWTCMNLSSARRASVFMHAIKRSTLNSCAFDCWFKKTNYEVYFGQDTQRKVFCAASVPLANQHVYPCETVLSEGKRRHIKQETDKVILIPFMTQTDGKEKINICHKDFQKCSKIKVPILLYLNIPVTKAAFALQACKQQSFPFILWNEYTVGLGFSLHTFLSHWVPD